MQWVTDQRVLYARRLLEETDLDIDRVADRCGLRHRDAAAPPLPAHHRCDAVGLPAQLRMRIRLRGHSPEPSPATFGVELGSSGSCLAASSPSELILGSSAASCLGRHRHLRRPARTGRRASARPARRPATSPAPDRAGRCRSATPRPAAPRATGKSLPRNTSSSRPRTWRSVPAYCCTRRAGPVAGGYPAARHAQRSTGTARSAALRAVQTVAPSSISAAENRGAVSVIGQQGGHVGEVANARTAIPRRPGRAPPAPPPAAHWCRPRGPAAGRRNRPPPGRCSADTRQRQQRLDVVGHRVAVVGARSPSRTRAAAWPGAGSPACPRPAARRPRRPPRSPTGGPAGHPIHPDRLAPGPPASAAA